MDTLAHGVLGAVLFSRSGFTGMFCRRYGIIAERRKGFDWTIVIAGAAGIIPDIMSFGVYAFQRIAEKRFETGPPALKTIPSYVFESYTVTHSMLTALTAVIICAILFRNIWPAILAWPFHILCDIPVHSHAFFPTPFLYPFSDWAFDGIPLVDNLMIVTYYWIIIILLCCFVHLHHTVIKWKKRYGKK